MIQYDITVYIGETMREKRLIIKCHDTGVTLAIRLATMYKAAKWLTEARDYTIPAGTTAILKIRKPDNTYVVADADIRNGRVVCQLPPQACTAPGISKAEVQLFGPKGKRLTSATFEFLVDEECLSDSGEESKPWVDVLGKQVTEAVSAAASAKEDADRAALASVNAPKIGSNGNWWVWDFEAGAYVDTGVAASGGGSGAVSSVNGKTGDVTLTAGDVGAVSVPATASVGQTVVVKAVDEAGKPTEWEAADAPSGVTDVKINDQSIVGVRGVAAIPKLVTSPLDNPSYGLPTLANGNTPVGIGLHLKGSLMTIPARRGDITNRKEREYFDIGSTGSDFHYPICPGYLDYSVKAAMCDGKGAAWTAEEQAAARERIGMTKTILDFTYDGDDVDILSIEVPNYQDVFRARMLIFQLSVFLNAKSTSWINSTLLSYQGEKLVSNSFPITYNAVPSVDANTEIFTKSVHIRTDDKRNYLSIGKKWCQYFAQNSLAYDTWSSFNRLSNADVTNKVVVLLPAPTDGAKYKAGTSISIVGVM